MATLGLGQSAAQSAAQPAATMPATTAPAAVAPAAGEAAPRGPLDLTKRYVPGTLVELMVPASWERLRSVAGFGERGGRTDVAVNEYPLPYPVAKGVVAPGGALIKNYTIDTRDEVTIEGRDGVLVRGTQLGVDGIEVRYWLIFGNRQRSVIVSSHYPQDRDKTLMAPVREMMLSAKWNPEGAANPLMRLPFEYKLGEGMRLASNVGERLQYTETGRRPNDPTKPIMQIFVSSRKLKDGLDKDEAEKSFKELSAGKPMKVLEFTKLRIPGTDGLEGWEGTGEVIASVKLTVTLYLCQVYSNDADAVYLVFGQCDQKDSDNWVRYFRTVARSLKERPAAVLQAETLVPPPPPPAEALPPPLEPKPEVKPKLPASTLPSSLPPASRPAWLGKH